MYMYMSTPNFQCSEKPIFSYGTPPRGLCFGKLEDKWPYLAYCTKRCETPSRIFWWSFGVIRKNLRVFRSIVCGGCKYWLVDFEIFWKRWILKSSLYWNEDFMNKKIFFWKTILNEASLRTIKCSDNKYITTFPF